MATFESVEVSNSKENTVAANLKPFENEKPSNGAAENGQAKVDTTAGVLPAITLVREPDPKVVEAMAATIRKATERDQWIDNGTDEKAIFVTLRDLSEGDRKALGAFYQKRYGISLEKEFEREMSGAHLANAKALLNRKDSSNGDAGQIHTLMVEANQLIAGRSKGNIAAVLRDKLTSASASEIQKIDADYQSLYGKSLRNALLNDVKFSRETKAAFEVLMKGSDKLTAEDHLKLADIAISSSDGQMFQQVMTNASAEARSKFIAAGGGARVKEAFAGHWYHALTAGLSGNVTNTELRHTQDYMKDGRLSATTKLKDNTSFMGDNEKAIEDALVHISDTERSSYIAARNEVLAGRQPSVGDKATYESLHGLLKSAGNATETAAWEAMIVHPGNKLAKELLSQRGIINDSNMHKMSNTLEQISADDWIRLKTNPRFRTDMERLLDTYMSDSEMVRMRESLDKLQACRSFGDVQVSGQRSVMNLLKDNHGYITTDEQAIVDGLAKMSPAEQNRYRTDAAFRAELDKKVAAALGAGSHGEAGKSILERVLKNESPSMTVIEKMHMAAAKVNVDEGQVIRDVQRAFRENPELRRMVHQPKDQSERLYADKFMKALKSCLDTDEFERYAKPLVETGHLSVDVQNEMDDWFLHTDKKDLLENIVSVSDEQRALLLDTSSSNKDAVKLQENTFGSLNEDSVKFAKTILQQRAYGPEDRVRSFVLGLGVAKEEALDLMSRLSSEQKQEVFSRYAAKYGTNLSVDFLNKVKKAERDQTELIARSHTLSAAEQLNTMLDVHSRSRQGVGKYFVDSAWDGTGFQSDEARNLMVQAMRKASLQGTELPAADATKFSMRTLETLANFRESKNKFGEVATDISITALAIGGAYFTAGASLSLLAKVAIAGSAGALIKVGGKSLVSGSDYNWSAKQVGLDGGVGFVYGATAFLGSQQMAKALNVGGSAGLRATQLVEANIARMAGQGGTKMIADGSQAVIQESLTGIARNMALRGSTKIPVESLAAIASHVATTGNEEAVKVALQVSLAQALKQHGLGTVGRVAVEYGLPAASGGLAGGAAGTVRGAADWDSDRPIDENLGRVGKSAATSAGIGTLSALAFKLGSKAVAAGYDAVTQYGTDQLANPDAYITNRADDLGIFKKKPVVLKAVQVSQPTTIQTMEGPVPANSGDWILTGVKGEQWPVRPEIFARSYDPVPGAADMFQKKPVEILAVQIDRAMNILDAAGATKYQGKPGDWLVIGLNGDKYFVNPEVFTATYGAVDQVAQRTSGATNSLEAKLGAIIKELVPPASTFATTTLEKPAIANAADFLKEPGVDLKGFRKAPVELKAVQAKEPMTIQTMEGPVKADAGDWIMTGVKGEQWPIKPEVFNKSYDATDKADIFKKRPVDVQAVQITAPMQIMENGQVKFTGKPTDWLVINFNGKPYFVDHEVFLKTFNPMDNGGAAMSVGKL